MAATGWPHIRKTNPHDPSKKLFEAFNQIDGKLIHMNYRVRRTFPESLSVCCETNRVPESLTIVVNNETEVH